MPTAIKVAGNSHIILGCVKRVPVSVRHRAWPFRASAFHGIKPCIAVGACGPAPAGTPPGVQASSAPLHFRCGTRVSRWTECCCIARALVVVGWPCDPVILR